MCGVGMKTRIISLISSSLVLASLGQAQVVWKDTVKLGVTFYDHVSLQVKTGPNDCQEYSEFNMRAVNPSITSTIEGMVQDTLDSEGKPVFKAVTGTIHPSTCAATDPGYCPGCGWYNKNMSTWFRAGASSGSSLKIEAESFTTMSGIATQATTDVGGGDNVGWIGAGDWMEYTSKNLTAGTWKLETRIATMATNRMIDVYVGGSKVVTVTEATNSGGWQNWITNTSATFTIPTSGSQTVRVNFVTDAMNVNWFRFVPVGKVVAVIQDTLPFVHQKNGMYEYNNWSFFPLDNKPTALTQTGDELKSLAPDPIHNFGFCMQIHNEMLYSANEAPSQVFNFHGDDDVWVFINKKLVLDVGGIHAAVTKTFKMSDVGAKLGLKSGVKYPFDFFYCERRNVESHIKVTTNLNLFGAKLKYNIIR